MSGLQIDLREVRRRPLEGRPCYPVRVSAVLGKGQAFARGRKAEYRQEFGLSRNVCGMNWTSSRRCLMDACSAGPEAMQPRTASAAWQACSRSNSGSTRSASSTSHEPSVIVLRVQVQADLRPNPQRSAAAYRRWRRG